MSAIRTVARIMQSASPSAPPARGCPPRHSSSIPRAASNTAACVSMPAQPRPFTWCFGKGTSSSSRKKNRSGGLGWEHLARSPGTHISCRVRTLALSHCRDCGRRRKKNTTQVQAEPRWVPRSSGEASAHPFPRPCLIHPTPQESFGFFWLPGAPSIASASCDGEQDRPIHTQTEEALADEARTGLRISIRRAIVRGLEKGGLRPSDRSGA